MYRTQSGSYFTVHFFNIRYLIVNLLQSRSESIVKPVQ